MNDCIFCKIWAGEIPSHRVYEDDNMLVIMDIHPASVGHLLVIPRRHAVLVHELSAAEAGQLMQTARMAEEALRQSELKPTATNFWINNGSDAGQEIAHVHLHIVPRYPEDGLRIQVPNRPQHKMDFAELAKKIRANIKPD